MAEILNVNSNLSLKIRPSVGFFRLLNNPALNVKLNLEVRIFNPNPWLNNRTQEGSFLQNVQPYGSKCQFEIGRRAPEFEPFANETKFEPENEKVETENDKFNSENFVTDIKIADVKTSQTEKEKEKTNFDTHITKTANEKLKFESRQELNTNIEGKTEIKNKQTAKTKTKSKAASPTIQKFSTHIKFIDHIPTHEIITYRHLFAYGFYVE